MLPACQLDSQQPGARRSAAIKCCAATLAPVYTAATKQDLSLSLQLSKECSVNMQYLPAPKSFLAANNPLHDQQPINVRDSGASMHSTMHMPRPAFADLVCCHCLLHKLHATTTRPAAL